jgi:hypothetical protein
MSRGGNLLDPCCVLLRELIQLADRSAHLPDAFALLSSGCRYFAHRGSCISSHFAAQIDLLNLQATHHHLVEGQEEIASQRNEGSRNGQLAPKNSPYPANSILQAFL